MFPVRVRSALRFSACQSGSVPEKSTPFFRPTHCSSLKAFAFRIQLPRPERVRRPKTRVLRVGRRACLWGHPPPSPPSPGRAPLSPLHRRTGAGGEMLFHPTTEGAVPLGHCRQYYSKYAGAWPLRAVLQQVYRGTLRDCEPGLSLFSLSQSTLPLPGFLSPLLSLLGISRAGLWIHPEGRANAPPCRAQGTVKG